MKVTISKHPSEEGLSNICKYLFELIEKKNIYDKIEKASK